MSKITESARGEECQIRLYKHCNGNPETTVFCHLGGAGMGRKSSDIHGAYGCSDCHDVVDGRVGTNYNTKDEVDLAFYEGVIRTQQILLEKGLIKT